MSSSRLVGRDRELSALRRALDEAAESRPGVVLIAGEAGIGKTRLVAELQCLAEARGASVVRGACVRLRQTDLPYAPLVAALRGVPPEAVRAFCSRLAGEAAAELAQLVPTLPRPSLHVGPGPGDIGQSRLFELVLGLLSDLAHASRPLVVALEDLHWADVSTLDMVAYLTRNLRSEPLLLVLTHRSDEAERGGTLQSFLAELRRESLLWPLELEPLTARQTAELLSELSGEQPGPELVTRVHARAGGNPFFVEELVRAGAGARLPRSLGEALLGRVSRLSRDAGALVDSAAVIGRPCQFNLLAEIAALDGAALSAALREALSHHLLVRSGEHGVFAFRHALVREAIYEDLLPGERTGLHHAAADALETLGAAPAEIAFHRLAAGEIVAGIAATVAAGREAARVHAFSDAREHLERALTAGPEALPVLDRIDVLGAAAEAARSTGDYEAARRRCREALSLIDGRTDPVSAAHLYERLGEYCFPDEEAALRCYSHALELLPETRGIERSRVLAAEARALAGLLRWRDAAERAQRAIDALADADAPAEAASAHSVLGLCLAFLGDPALGSSHAREAVALAERSKHGEDLARAYLVLAEVLRLRGRADQAYEDMVRARKQAERFGLAESFGRFMVVAAADDLFALGRWDDAGGLLEEAACMELGPVATILYHVVAAQIAAGRGDAALARSHLGGAEAASPDGPHPEYAPFLASAAMEAALWEGEPAVARRRLDAALDAVGSRRDPLNTPVLYSMGSRVEADLCERDASMAADTRRRIDTLISQLQDIVDRHTGVASPAVAQAHLALCRAERSRAARRPDADLWAAAAHHFVRMGQPYPEAYAAWREAEAILTRRAARGAATAPLRRASSIALQLGARPLAREVERLARRARIDLAPIPAATEHDAARSSGGAELGLTPRETEVLLLMADGRTNREIAEALFISHRTAGVHVSRILAKLDVQNRVEAAGRAIRLGLVSESQEALPPSR